MKSLSILIFLLAFLNYADAQTESQIYSIDDYSPSASVELSEKALPNNALEELLNDFTPISSAQANELFNTLTSDSRARMKNPGGSCQGRRIYIQNYLKKRNIESGRIYIDCPGNIGRLRLQDQVSGRFYTFSNFHDANVVRSTSGGYLVMDLQFQPGPMTLESYLAQIEANQALRPATSLDDEAGVCYWSVQ